MQSNIETIIKQLKKESKLVIQFRKYNGISLECRTAIDGDRDKAIAEMRTILDKCNFVPYDIERHKEVPNAFLVQFPNLDVTYTEDEKIKMYKDIFKFLLDTVNRNQETMIPKSQIIDYKDLYTKQTIEAFARSNVNPYYITKDDMLNDIDFRNHLDTLFLKYVDEYIKDMTLRNGD